MTTICKNPLIEYFKDEDGWNLWVEGQSLGPITSDPVAMMEYIGRQHVVVQQLQKTVQQLRAEMDGVQVHPAPEMRRWHAMH